MRTELAATRAEGDKLASAINEVKSAPRGDGAAPVDLSGIDERIAKIESLMRAQGAEIAQQGSKLADVKADAKPADDMPLRRLVAAALLDVLVRIGEPYPTALAATKALTPNPDALKPLDPFAEKGVPNAGRLSTELLALVPKLLPAARPSRAPPRPARASSSVCRRALQNWSRSNAPIPPAPIVVPWWRGSLRLRCEMTSTRRGGN